MAKLIINLQNDIEELVNLLKKASKPIFYTGGSVVNSGPNASELLRELVRATGFPVLVLCKA